MTFELFLADMGQKPAARMSIERLDVNGNYAPANCVWATQLEQAKNTRLTKLTRPDVLAFKSGEITAAELMSRTGCSKHSVAAVKAGRNWKDVVPV